MFSFYKILDLKVSSVTILRKDALKSMEIFCVKSEIVFQFKFPLINPWIKALEKSDWIRFNPMIYERLKNHKNFY